MNLALSSAAGTAACTAWRQSPAVNLECKHNATTLGGVPRPLLGLTMMSASFSPRPAQSLSCEGALHRQNAIATHDLTPPLVRSPRADCHFGHISSPKVCSLNQCAKSKPLVSFQLTCRFTQVWLKWLWWGSLGCLWGLGAHRDRWRSWVVRVDSNFTTWWALWEQIEATSSNFQWIWVDTVSSSCRGNCSGRFGF